MTYFLTFFLFCVVGQLTRNSVEDPLPTQFTHESLKDWKKALSLVLMNRSSNDSQVIGELGQQLKQVGSLLDAWVWYDIFIYIYIIILLTVKLTFLESFMLSPDTFASRGGILCAEGTEIYTDLDALYLTELYEYGCKVQLPQYKLIHAWWLSEFEMTQEAQIYCDALAQNTTLEDITGLKSLGEICDTVTDR